MSLALTGKKREQAEKFYDKLLKLLTEKKLPFMIGGTYAYNFYTGLDRPTGDIDLRCPAEDYPRILRTLTEAGYKTELTDGIHWLAKVRDEQGFYTDIIFGDRNGLYQIQKSWLSYARNGLILGHKVKVEPVEELIRSKLYVQNRDRNDSGDVVHLILKQGKNINWERLLKRVEPHWELLFVHILAFIFIYPSERNVIPQWVIKELTDKLMHLLAEKPPREKITRGLLLSADYQVGVSQWGYKPITELK